MNLRDLQYLVTLAETRHFGEAAAKVHISQPTLSMQLKKLEATLGGALFERGARRVMLTPLGEHVLAHATRVLEEVAQMKRLAELARDPLAGTLRLGIFPTLAPYLLPQMMPTLARAFPKLETLLIEEKTPVLVEQLTRGVLDAAILAMPVAGDHFIHAPLFEEPFLLAVAPRHALAKRREVHVSDLATQRLLLLEDGHCLRDQALEVCQRIGLAETSGFRATSLETLRHMVATSDAVTLMPSLATRHNKTARYIPFSDIPPSRQIGLYWRTSSHRGVLYAALAGLVREAVTPLLATAKPTTKTPRA
jgi:LysR family hydrogen peroxide-inducible transcriptional activator